MATATFYGRTEDHSHTMPRHHKSRKNADGASSAISHGWPSTEKQKKADAQIIDELCYSFVCKTDISSVDVWTA